MQPECISDLFGFASVQGRHVVASFGGGAITSDAGGLLLGATDRSLGLVDRFAGCFCDIRCADLIEHAVRTLVGQRVFGIALGYEDLIDHDELRHDPVMALLAGKLEARRQDCAPVAGKSTLNRLELSTALPTRYHKISHDAGAIERLLVELFVEAHRRPPQQIVLDLDATDDPLHGEQEGRFFHGYYDCYCYLPLYVFCGRHLLAAKLRRSNIDAAAGAVEEMSRIVAQIRSHWPTLESYFAVTNRHDVDSMIAAFADDAIVKDEGHEHRGTAAIRGWMNETIRKYNFRAEPTSVVRANDQTAVTVTVSGNFPGSPHYVDILVQAWRTEDRSAGDPLTFAGGKAQQAAKT